jgi:intracellular sulfur oxidation DsrE/DsrF family protein
MTCFRGKSSVLDRLESLKKSAGKGVEYTVCSNTMKAMGVDGQKIVGLVADLYPGVVRIVELQEPGYVYLRP